MRKRLFIAILSAASAFSIAPAMGTSLAFVNGASYLAMSQNDRATYIEGLYDMMAREDTSGELNANAQAYVDRLMRCAANMTAGQLTEIVDASIAQNPTWQTYTMASNFRTVFNQRCPQ